MINTKNMFTKTTVLAILMIIAVLISGCDSQNSESNDSDKNKDLKACTMDAKICSDGSAVGRDGSNNCEFFPCPEDSDNSGSSADSGKIDPRYRNYAANSIEECAATTFICDVSGTKMFFDQSGCGCEAEEPKKYTSQDLDECSRIRYMCEQNYVPFTDAIGCGCEFSWDDINAAANDLQEGYPDNRVFYCTEEQKAAEICTLEYMPVCGWFNKDIQCIRYPCAQTYGNICGACADEKVEYYTNGECPTG